MHEVKQTNTWVSGIFILDTLLLGLQFVLWEYFESTDVIYANICVKFVNECKWTHWDQEWSTWLNAGVFFWGVEFLFTCFFKRYFIKKN